MVDPVVAQPIPPKTRLIVRVVDGFGASLPQAEIEVVNFRVELNGTSNDVKQQSDIHGRHDFGLVDPRIRFDIKVRKSGFGPPGNPFTPGENGIVRRPPLNNGVITLVLTRNVARLTVLVTDATASIPLAGANVGVDGITGTPMPVTGPSGKAGPFEVAVGVNFRMHADHTNFGPNPGGTPVDSAVGALRTLKDGEDVTEELRLHQTPLTLLNVHVVDGFGANLANVQVTVAGHGTRVTGANGLAAFGLVPAFIDCDIKARKPEHGPKATPFVVGDVGVVRQPPPGGVPVELVLTRNRARLTVLVSNATAHVPLEKANVGVDGVTGTPMPLTKPDGTAGPFDVPAGVELRIHAQLDNFGPAPGGAGDLNHEVATKQPPLTDGQVITVPLELLELGRVTKINLQVPTTQSARGAHAIAPPLAHHDHSRASADKALAANAPVVLLRNCAELTLTAETSPAGLPVNWAVEPNPGPAAPLPALAPASGVTTKLKTDASGGYAVVAKLGTSTMVFNIVFVDVTIVDSTILLNDLKFHDNSGGGFVGMDTGSFNVAAPAVCAMHATANIRLTAGGQAALDGFCDKVTVGMPQSLLSDSAAAQYSPGGQERERINITSGLHSPVIDPAVTVTDLGFPILDRGGQPAAIRATGGSTIFLASTVSTPANGLARKIETCDSPGVGFHALLPEFHAAATKPAISISGENAFKLYLVAFSTDADFSYVAFGSVTWTANYSGTIAPSASGGLHWTRTAAAGITGGGSFTAIPHGKEAKDAGCEVRPPVFLDYIIDAR